MEVYVESNKKDDGVVTKYLRDIQSVYVYEFNGEIRAHVIDFAEEGSLIFDVIKLEVY